MSRNALSLVFAVLLLLVAATLAAAPDGPDLPNATTAVAVQRISARDLGISDEVAMVLAGTILLAVAGAVRRAI
jgi:hypothetical protein